MSSAAISPETLIGQLNWRYAVRKFDASRSIPAPLWSALEHALVLTPSSFGLQPWKFIIVDDKALRVHLRQASWDQAQITDASRIVVFAQKKDITSADISHFIQRTAEVRHIPAASLDGYKAMIAAFIGKSPDVNAWAACQLYIAVGNFLTSAALLGLDSSPLEGLDPSQYDAILDLEKQGLQMRCVVAVGYRAADDRYADAPKVRFEPQDVITHL